MARTRLPDRVATFGRPGSGKSSLVERLGVEHGYVLVRTGELFREAVRRGDPLGVHVEQLLKRGALVPDPLVEEVLARMLEATGTHRLLFDGFPRTLSQVPVLAKFERLFDFAVECFLEVAVSHEAAVARMTGRRVCPVCGATYHVATQPPRVPGVCDHEGASLEQRRDDSPDVIEVRQRVYDEHTLPVLDYYRTHAPDSYRAVDAGQPFDTVYAEVSRVLAEHADDGS